jgi:DNA-binding GntR family transcriptional regulator
MGTKTGNGTRVDEAHTLIRDDIIGCVLEPGQRTSMPELARRYGIGDAAVRAAMTRLQQERLVQAIPRGGYLIEPVTLELVEDLNRARLAIEPGAAWLATPRITGEDLVCLADLCRQARYRPGDRESIGVYMQANRAFHLLIAGRAGSPRLVQIAGQLMDATDRISRFIFMQTDQSEQMAREHQAIIDALATGEPERAERAVRAHAEASVVVETEWVLATLRGQPLRLPSGVGWSGK